VWKFICDRQWNDAYDMKSRALYMYLYYGVCTLSQPAVLVNCPCQLCELLLAAGCCCWPATVRSAAPYSTVASQIIIMLRSRA
jgi:hypothetical protein